MDVAPPTYSGIETLGRLRVYVLARRFAVDCCGIARLLPQPERSSLGNQLLRSAVSVKSNIAEGHGRRGSDTDFRRFLRDARGSLIEAYSQLELVSDLRIGNRDAVELAMTDARKLDRLLGALINRLNASANAVR